jgi:hypothetical protein
MKVFRIILRAAAPVFLFGQVLLGGLYLLQAWDRIDPTYLSQLRALHWFAPLLLLLALLLLYLTSKALRALWYSFRASQRRVNHLAAARRMNRLRIQFEKAAPGSKKEARLLREIKALRKQMTQQARGHE